MRNNNNDNNNHGNKKTIIPNTNNYQHKQQQQQPSLSRPSPIQMFHKTNKAKMLIMPLAILLLSSTVVMATSNSILPSAAYAITFGDTKNLSNNAGDSRNPAIESVSGNNVYTLWADSTGGTDLDLFFKRSDTSGDSFHDIKDLSIDKTGDVRDQHITKEGNNVYVVWSQNGEVYFKRSTNNGENFGSTLNLSNDANISDRPEIAAVSGGNIYVVWVSSLPDEDSDQLFFKRSTNNGDTFSSVKKLDISNEDLRPKIAASGSNVYIASEQGKEGDVGLYFTKSTDKGSNFSQPIILLDRLGHDVFLGDMAAKSGSGNVYITWSDGAIPGGGHTFFVRSTNGGTSFDSIKDFGLGFNPQLDTVSSNVYVVWPNGDGNITFKSSKDNGANFGSTTILNSANSIGTPQISAIGNAVRIVWAGSAPNSADIFFISSGNEGDSFGSIKNLSNNAGLSRDPQIISSGNKAYVIWSDDTPGNFDILFKKGVD